MNHVKLIAMREFSQRTSSRAFKIATIITILVALGYVIIPHVLSAKAKPETIALVGGVSKEIPTIFSQVAALSDTKVRFVSVSSISQARDQLTSGQVSVAYSPKVGLLVKTVSSTDQATIFAREVSADIGKFQALQRANLTQAQKKILLSPTNVRVTAVASTLRVTPSTQKASIFELILTYVLLSQYGAWVMLGVIEEKSTRVVEVLLSAVRPIELLVGKIIGVGLVALVHAGLILAALLIGLNVIGSNPLQVLPNSLIVLAPLWLIVGGALYCTIFGAVGSMVTRIEDAQAVSFPVAVPMLVGYIVGLTAISQTSPPSLAIKILSFVPGVSPFLDPVMVASGVMSVPQMLLSLAISLVTTYFLSKVAGKISVASILKIGPRVKLSAIRKSFSNGSS